MNHKLLPVLLSALALGTVASRAQTPAPEPAPAAPSSSWVLTPSFVSQYMFRGARLGGASFQPSIEYDAGNLAVGVWANQPLANKVVGQSDPEIDPYGSFKIVVNDSLNVQPGFTWYNYPNANTKNGFFASTFEPNIAVNYTVGGVTFTPKLYYDFVLHGPTYELTGAYAVPLKDFGTELDFTATGGSFKWSTSQPDQGVNVKNLGNYWLAGVSLPFQVTKDSKFIVGWAYTEGSANFIKYGSAPRSPNPAALGRGVATVSFAISF